MSRNKESVIVQVRTQRGDRCRYVLARRLVRAGEGTATIAWFDGEMYLVLNDEGGEPFITVPQLVYDARPHRSRRIDP